MSNKILNRRQTRWSKFLFKYNYEIIYNPGLMNNKTGIFTRRFGDVFKKKLIAVNFNGKQCWKKILEDTPSIPHESIPFWFY